MLIALPFILFVLIAGIIGVFGFHYYVKPSRLLDQLSSSSDPVSAALREHKKNREFSLARLLEPIGNLLPVSPQAAGILKKDLTAAGIRSPSAIPVFYGAKIVLAVVFVVLALTARNHVDSPVSRMMYPIAGRGLGSFLPTFTLGRLTWRGSNPISLSLAV